MKIFFFMLIMASYLISTAVFGRPPKTVISFFDDRQKSIVEAIDGEVIIILKKNIKKKTIQALHDSYGNSVEIEIAELNCQLVRLAAGISVPQAVSEYRKISYIEHVEPNYIGHQSGKPNDHFYSQQWYLPHIHAPEAWDIQTGSPNVIVGILDTGVDTDHPDLATKIWRNADEIPGNNIDDDNNGYIDDVNGWDFVTIGHNSPADNDPNPEPNGIDDDKNGRIDSGCSHGTHVAGIIGAETNTNRVGVAGIGWGVTLMPVRVGDDEGNFAYWDIIYGLVYAVKNGARILNCSFGGPYAETFSITIEYLYKCYNSIIITSAGNKGIDLDESRQSPVCNDGNENMVLGVAATDTIDRRSLFGDSSSNFSSRFVDVSAPGLNIFNCFYLNPEFGFNIGWDNKSGTSMAAPVVSGIAALILSNHPDWSNREVMDQIINTTVNIDAQNPEYAGKLGTGRVDALKALSDATLSTAIFCTAIPPALPNDGTSTSTIRATILDRFGHQIQDATNPIAFSITTGANCGQLVGQNPVNAVDGVGTIQFQASGVPGTVMVEASSNGLISGNIGITIFSSENMTAVGGVITSNTTWTLSNSPYHVTSEIIIRSGATLTIHPGVIVLFDSNTSIRVSNLNSGALWAEANIRNPILFSSYSGKTGGWEGIHFDNYSDSQLNSSLKYCIIENAGQPNYRGVSANLDCYLTNMPVMESCTIRHSTGHAIYLEKSSPQISNSTIENSSPHAVFYLRESSPTLNGNRTSGINSEYWLFSTDFSSNPILTNNLFYGTVTNAIRVGTNSKISSNEFRGATNAAIEVWGGEITSSKVWGPQNGISTFHIIQSDLLIISKSTLRIEPGTQLGFSTNAGIRVGWAILGNREGALIAEGTATNPIIFNSISGKSGDWKGIMFDDYSDYNMNSILKHCVIENAGHPNYYGIGSTIFSRRTIMPIIENCTLRNSSDHEIYCTESPIAVTNSTISNRSNTEIIFLEESSPSIIGNSITGVNNSYWLYCSAEESNPIIINNTFHGRVKNALRVGTNSKIQANHFLTPDSLSIEVWGDAFDKSTVWNSQIGLSQYKIINADLEIKNNFTFTLEPGVSLLFENGTGIKITGSINLYGTGFIHAEGNAKNPITFTSASGKSGDWKGVLIDNNSGGQISANLSYCIIEKAGQGFESKINAAVFCRNTTNPIFRNCTIQNNLNENGIACSESSPNLIRCRIINNSGNGIYCTEDAQPIIGNSVENTCDIFNNGGFNIFIDQTKNVEARYNYWGSIDEIIIQKEIYDKFDNVGRGQVFFTPWATESGGTNQPPTFFSLLSPQNYITLKTQVPEFCWQKSVDPDGIDDPVYTLQVSDQADFTKNYFEFSNIQAEVYTFPRPLADTSSFFWRVKATDAEGAETWSNETWKFIINTSSQNNPPSSPQIVLPDNGVEIKPGDYLIWTQSTDPDVEDQVTYNLQIDDSSDFKAPLLLQTGIFGESNPAQLTEHSSLSRGGSAVYIRLSTLNDFQLLKDDQTYFWRVQAEDNFNTKSDFTGCYTHFFFNKINSQPGAVVSGFSPKDGIEVRTNRPTLSWQPAIDPDLSDHAGVLYYCLKIDDEVQFNPPTHYELQTAPGINSFDLPVALAENQHWHYQVQAIDDEGATSTWSNPQNFWVNALDEPPHAFIMREPRDQSRIDSDQIIFRWGDTSDPDPNDKLNFILEISDDPAFSGNILSFSVGSDTSKTVSADTFTVNRQYWRVKAVDTDALFTFGNGDGKTLWEFDLAASVVSNRIPGEIPQNYYLAQNFPNPFNPETDIRFGLTKAGNVALTVYNTLGQRIKIVCQTEKAAGNYQVRWDGNDELGNAVAAGIYFYVLQCRDIRLSRKLILMY